MFKRIAVVVAWVVATFATAAITLAAVGQAGQGVADSPAVPVPAQDLAVEVAATTSASSSSSTTSSPTTSPGASGTVTTTTAAVDPGSAASTTTVLLGLQADSRVTAGGTVFVVVVGSELSLSSAVPAAGFGVEVESGGPGGIEVKFESHDRSIEIVVVVSLENGAITWEIDAGA